MKKVERSLMVVHKIIKLERATKKKGARITFELAYPPYLESATKRANDLVDKLFTQSMGGDIEIMGLCLTWSEEVTK